MTPTSKTTSPRPGSALLQRRQCSADSVQQRRRCVAAWLCTGRQDWTECRAVVPHFLMLEKDDRVTNFRVDRPRPTKSAGN